ncbi:hypothetical protein FGIG_09381 [Fasciola gigantica]|uniref:Uncharacterized protein n=1 Tax=Fasciola gigantica TaxID=46835 RepID=A0A504YRU1_FASGI|nr:hypothetical protein FGIG_09381 [Fasciola gigantica]
MLACFRERKLHCDPPLYTQLNHCLYTWVVEHFGPTQLISFSHFAFLFPHQKNDDHNDKNNNNNKSENREKFDIVFSDEISPKTLDFKHRIFYHFVPEMSVASPELGKITIPNLFTAGLLERQSPTFFMNGPFATLSPYDAMWNHYPMLFSSINVGLFASQNGTKPVQYKIHTGSHDISKVGSIIEVNGQK